MKILTLMRGLSGSGKTTEAEKLLSGDAMIVSTDDFWMDSNGNYAFDYSRIGEAHDYARGQVTELMENGTDHIIVDNTNTRWWEMMPYLKLAREHGYGVETRNVGAVLGNIVKSYAARNTHGVTEDIIERQVKNFEMWNDPTSGYFLECARDVIGRALKEGDPEHLVCAAEMLKQAIEHAPESKDETAQ